MSRILCSYYYVIVVLFSSVFAASYDRCPPASQIKPCTCNNYIQFYLVDCGGITDMETLVGIFDRSGDRKFDNFALHDSTLMYLPASSLSAKQFSSILLVNVSMTSFFDHQPDSTNQVSYITILNSRIHRRVGWELFQNLNKLHYIFIEDTEISKLGSSFANSVSSNLSKFMLHRTKTTKLHETAFARMVNLELLEITETGIKTVTRSMFSRPSKLETISFESNLIKTLPDDIFSDMPVLKEINLAKNKISTISEAAFGHRYSSLTQLDLEGNPIICDCKVRWIVPKRNKNIKGSCALPDDKTGRPLASLNQEDFRYCD